MCVNFRAHSLYAVLREVQSSSAQKLLSSNARCIITSWRGRHDNNQKYNCLLHTPIQLWSIRTPPRIVLLGDAFA